MPSATCQSAERIGTSWPSTGMVPGTLTSAYLSGYAPHRHFQPTSQSTGLDPEAQSRSHPHYQLSAGPDICRQNMQLMTELCTSINAPMKHEKTEGPATSITFIGIRLDSVAMTGSITPACKEELLQSLRTFITSRTCTK